MIFEADVVFNLIKTVLTTALTLGLMISLTEFGFSALINVFLLTITAPTVAITFVLAKDNAMKAIFNYMTQVNLCMLLSIPVAFINHGSMALELFLRAVLLGSMITINYFFIRKPFRRLADILDGNWIFMALVPTAF